MFGKCRKSQAIRDTPHKLWISFEKKTARICHAHCTCMAGMGQTCNDVAAVFLSIEAMVRMRLTNPSCTSKPNEWLPCTKNVTPERIKDIDFENR